jgi:hypothetical protein
VSNLVEKPVAAEGEKNWIFGRKIEWQHDSSLGSGFLLRRGKSPCPPACNHGFLGACGSRALNQARSGASATPAAVGGLL